LTVPSTLTSTAPEFHVAIIMDGNGRWAQDRGKPRIAGHREGAKAVQRTVEAAPSVGITTLTLYAFSSDNWQRPKSEVDALMRLLLRYLRTEVRRSVENGVRLNVIGRRDRLSKDVVDAIVAAEHATRHGKTLRLRLAIDYSARHAIATAAQASQQSSGEVSTEKFAALLGAAIHDDQASPDVDLLIRTSGEQRLSDFLLWECAYAELAFTETRWPDFGSAELAQAIETFSLRDRRFGRISEAASS
jgi:undecaprenyl diphosphate synthase